MRIVIAPDSYKGSASAVAVADAMERGFLAVFPDAGIHKVPIADGGEGTVEALVAGTGGHTVEETVSGPLGEHVRALWGVLGDSKTAVIEMAAASGLTLIPSESRDPRITTTYGTGQLIRAALDHGLRRVIVGIGGSATNDGGAGMASALGARFLDRDGRPLPPGGAALAGLARIDVADTDTRLAQTEVLVACDVTNPLCGPDGATHVYGPQKGATPSMVAELDAALEVFAEEARRATGKDAARVPGAGAAGGLGAGLIWFTGAVLRPGIEIVLAATGFDALVRQVDLVITGEGRTDFQTAFGKAPVGVARAARLHGKPVVCLSGSLGDGAEEVLKHGVDAIESVLARPTTIEQAMASAEVLIEQAAARVARLLKVGMSLRGPK
ncbi:MAG: glycerate kinase [Thermodesulfobacteriota bacterium]